MSQKQVQSPWMKVWSGLLVGVLVAILLLALSNIASADEPAPTPAPDKTTGWITMTVGSAVVSQGSQRPLSQNPKLGSTLNQLVETRNTVGLAGAQAFAGAYNMTLVGDRVQVELVVTSDAVTSDLVTAIEAEGGEYQGRYQTLVQALVPIQALAALAQRPDVQLIRDPVRLAPLEFNLDGAVNTEGLGPANASAWHARGFTGAGVKIGVVDGGFTNYTSLLGSDLPATVIARDYTGTGMGGTTHGTACAEIIHDMAPGAALYLSKVSTRVELDTAVDDLISSDVDIISMSGGFYLDGPGDGTGYLASMVANARAHGILFVTAAGNDAELHWSGSFNNDGNGYHLWATNQNINYFGPGHTDTCYGIPAGTPIIAALRWDDWTAVNQDYDLELYRWTGSSWSYVAGSYNNQAGSYPTPEEFIGVYAPATSCYGVVVVRHSATRNVCLSLTASLEHLDEWVPGRSLTFPADAAGALSVGAVDVTSYALESYSSRGPTFGSGGICSGGATKPDMMGYANVSTVSYGAREFNGTSAATPHVAGGAALVKQAFPGYSVSQLQNYLENNAIDLGVPGKDDLYGSGRLYLAASATPTPTPTPTPSHDGDSFKVYLPGVLKNYKPGPAPAPTSTLTPPPSSCPRTGTWTGTTSSGYPISFTVYNTPSCYVKYLSIRMMVSCGAQPPREVYVSFGNATFSISNNRFSTGNPGTGWPRVIGNFTPPTTVTGTWLYLDSSCQGSGSWTANP
jgi:hypothetical protein